MSTVHRMNSTQTPVIPAKGNWFNMGRLYAVTMLWFFIKLYTQYNVVYLC
jgi:hypothetical protein